MKNLLLLTGALLTVSANAATLTLSDFSDFTPTYYGLSGSWSAQTATSAPTTFSIENTGSSTPRNDGSFTVDLGGSQDWSAYQFVNLNGVAGADNATGQFSFFVEDSSGSSTVVTFNIADFVSGSSSLSLTNLFAGVDASQIVNWGFSTENQAGNKDFAFTFDNLTLSTTAVPEPSTYALWTAGLGLAAAGVLRRQRRNIA